MEEDIKMALRGRLAEVMVKLTTQILIQNLIYDKGWPVLYVTLEKAL